MGALKSLVICFAVFSKIPMPFMDWEEKDMKYIFCFLPFVGLVMSVVFCGVYVLNVYLKTPSEVLGVSAMGITMLINGGIHMDGFMDTVDALSSHKSKEEKLRILDDPHTGAFAIIYAIFYVLTVVYILSTVNNLKEAALMSVIFVFSRALVSVVAVSENLSKEKGMLYTFVSATNKPVTVIISVVWLFAAMAVMEMLAPVRSIITLGAVFIFVLIFQNMSRKEFGGISGDLMGFFICVVQLIGALIIGVGDFIC